MARFSIALLLFVEQTHPFAAALPGASPTAARTCQARAFLTRHRRRRNGWLAVALSRAASGAEVVASRPAYAVRWTGCRKAGDAATAIATAHAARSR
jgi:hypothetical protein